MAVALPAVIVLGLRMMPTDEWAERVIRRWAESEGLRIETIEKGGLIDRLYLSGTCAVYRVRVRDDEGRERECKAVVGRFMLGWTAPNLAITWAKPRRGDS